MVAIGLHVNWSVLGVCVSKCRPMFAGCVGGEGDKISADTHACCHVAKRSKLVIKAWCPRTGLESQEVSRLWLNRNCGAPSAQPYANLPRPKARTLQVNHLWLVWRLLGRGWGAL